MPLLPMKIKFRRGFKKWVDEKALDIRKQLGKSNYAPICAFDLCKLLRIPVYTPRDIQGLSSQYIDNLLNDGSSHWSAVTIPIKKNEYIIIHNPIHTPARQQSNLMHEIAHILCGHCLIGSKKIAGLPECLRDFNEDQENEADWLGGCLLLPRPALLFCLQRGMSVEAIASRYNCSVEMAKYRINITGAKIQMNRYRNQVYQATH